MADGDTTTASTSARTISNLRKRRGVVRASITRLGNRLKELEGSPDLPNTAEHAQQLKSKLESLDSEFRVHHLQLVDLIDDDPSLEKEQDTLDKLDDDVTSLTIRLRQLIVRGRAAKSATPTSGDGKANASSRKLSRLEKGLSQTHEALASDPSDRSLLEQYREQLSDYKRDLASIYEELLALEVADDDERLTLHSRLEKLLFECSHQLKKLLGSRSSEPSAVSSSDSGGMKLPKLDVPTFDGNILNWKQFWEQFTVSVHDRSSLSDAERLVYLQQAIKDGPAKSSIEGLSRSGDHYKEAVECLRSRYDRPRLIQRTHVRMIVDAPPLKDGSGKELRRLHDTIKQHLRALENSEHELPGTFITSIIELKLDTDTMFEWQKHTQTKTDVPPYRELLEFMDLRAQASETSLSSTKRATKNEPPKRSSGPGRTVASFTANSKSTSAQCVLCANEKHPLYACSKFKSLSHEEKISTLKENNLCMNCLNSGHFVKHCKSIHRCRKCQRPHHTLLHVETQSDSSVRSNTSTESTNSKDPTKITSYTAVRLKSSSLLMTCRVLVTAPDGSTIEARALLDNASSTSFVSERLVQSLCLPRTNQNVRVSGIAGMSHKAPIQSISTFKLSAVKPASRKIDVTAVVVPRVTCDLPLAPVPFDLSWKHISDIPLADPGFGQPGRVDILLGVDIFVDVLLHGRRRGPPGTPTAFETEFGWVLSGCTETSTTTNHALVHVATFHTSVTSGDDILHKFWEVEESPKNIAALSLEERTVVRHFNSHHSRTNEGRFVVPLPKKPDAKPIGESRSQAVRRFMSLERSLNLNCRFSEFESVMQEYLDLGHAERVSHEDMDKPQHEVFYLPMHAVYKSSSTTTKVRAVFDASAKSSSGVSLNDTLLVGPTVHPPLIDVLLRFRLNRIALTADVSKMYRAIELTLADRDLHRFVWRSSPKEALEDYRMTRLTFGVSASSFAANMAVKQNAIDHAHEFPLAADVVEKSFYVDDCLSGADTPRSAIMLQQQLHGLFARGGFLLRKWNSSDPLVLQSIPEDLRDLREVHPISETNEYTKTLGLEWNVTTDQFHLTISDSPPTENVTKRAIVSDIAKVFDALGWFSPVIAKMKILLQRLWERKVDWDDPVPQEIYEAWLQWRSELPSLASKSIPRCYSPKEVSIVSVELHGFSDASEDAYAGVVYMRMVDSNGKVHTSLVMSKTKVAPIKRLSIPRLELCGAQVLAQLLQHVKDVFQLPMSSIFAWTDSTIVLSWLTGNPRRFKTFVGNRVSFIIDQIPPDRWNHIAGAENPADCASRGLLPTELLEHPLWWNGPPWLRLAPCNWPKRCGISVEPVFEEEREVSLVTTIQIKHPIIPLDQYSKFTRLQRVTAWVLRFVHNCRAPSSRTVETNNSPSLTISELVDAERYWILLSQQEHFLTEIKSLKAKCLIPKDSCLLPFRPFLDQAGILRVGGRESNAELSYSRTHPIILHGKHPISKLIIRSEHLRLLHTGPTLLISSLNHRFHIICLRKTVRSITRQCVTCRRLTVKPRNQMLGQLPFERVTPGSVFEKVGVDYAGPFQIKYGFVRRPTIVKAYICIFVSLSVKAVHLELVSDLTAEAFLASLRRFIARRGHPSLIWSDHGTNFVGASRELNELVDFLRNQKTQKIISEFCACRKIEWKLIPEHAPHFGGLWEAAVKSTKKHLKCKAHLRRIQHSPHTD